MTDFNPTPNAGAVDPNVEGAFRRGYAHAIADVARLLKAKPALTAAELSAWERSAVDKWRHDQPLNRQIDPPLYR